MQDSNPLNNDKKGYNDSELNEFKELINAKLAYCNEKIDELQARLKEYAEDSRDNYKGDLTDVSNLHDEKEVLLNLFDRERRYKVQLENALLRIRNKTYGICVVTGEKINKNRLMLVPTTTKVVEVK